MLVSKTASQKYLRVLSEAIKLQYLAVLIITCIMLHIFLIFESSSTQLSRDRVQATGDTMLRDQD